MRIFKTDKLIVVLVALYGRRFHVDASYNLVIRRVTPSDQGLYLCRTHNHLLSVRLVVHSALLLSDTAMDSRYSQ